MIDIRGFLETSMLDWDGKISSVIFLSGCNLKCGFCHNYPLVFEPHKLKKFEFGDIKKYLLAHRNWIDGVVISGGEPTIYPDLDAFIKQIKDMGFAVKLDTNGTNPEMLKRLIENKLVDYVAMDVKGPFNSKYDLITRTKVDLDDIKRSVDLLLRSDIGSEFRTTVVPQLLDLEDIKSIAQSIAGAKRFLLQQFQPSNAMDESLRSITPYSKEVLIEMAEAAKKYVPNTVLRGV